MARVKVAHSCWNDPELKDFSATDWGADSPLLSADVSGWVFTGVAVGTTLLDGELSRALLISGLELVGVMERSKRSSALSLSLLSGR